MANELMVDLETLGSDTAPRCAVLSIGAVVFDPTRRDQPDDLHAEGLSVFLDPHEQLRRGALVDWSTILWWHQQEVLARTTMFKEGLKRLSLKAGLELLDEYIRPYKPTHIWGNGPSFDCAILNNLYQLAEMTNPFKYYQQQCVRTIGKAAKIKRSGWGTAHDALDDAVAQAVYVQQCYHKLGLSEED